MTHDNERRCQERDTYRWEQGQRRYGRKSDLDAILQAKAEREEKERKAKTQQETESRSA